MAWYKQAQGEDLKDFSYGAESYDATILAALAAAKGGANDSRDGAEELRRRLGCDRGRRSAPPTPTAWRCIEGGKEIRYTGPSGIGPIDDENDPSSAFIGIYQYDANNKNILSGTVEGSKPVVD